MSKITSPIMTDETGRLIAEAISGTSDTKKRIEELEQAVEGKADKNDIPYVTPEMFGAKADGVTDDTSALQEAVNYAAEHAVMLVLNKTYAVSKVELKDGIPKVACYSGKIICTNHQSGMNGVFYSETAINNICIDSLEIDCNNNIACGLFAILTNSTITNCKIYGFENPEFVPNGLYIRSGSHDLTISNNFIYLAKDEPYHTFSGSHGIRIAGTPTSTYGGLDTLDYSPDPTEYNYNVIITNNHVYNGTHGIMLLASKKCIVSENYVYGCTHRCIILSPQARECLVTDNICEQFGASGIHIAYGSNNNLVDGNHLISYEDGFSARNSGQYAINVYMFCENNTISNNKIYNTSSRGGVYTANCSNGTIIKGNDISVRMLGIGLETDWALDDVTEKQPYSYIVGAPPYNPNWTSWSNGGATKDVQIVDNIIKTSDYNRKSGIYICVYNDSLCENLLIKGNKIERKADDGANDFYFYTSDATLVKSCKIVDNYVQKNCVKLISDLNEFNFADYSGGWLNEMFTVYAGNDTIDVSKSNYIFLRQGSNINKATGINSANYREITLCIMRTSTAGSNSPIISGDGLVLKENIAEGEILNDGAFMKFVVDKKNEQLVEISRNF